MSDSVGFMISDVSRLMRRRFDERARLMGVTRTQWRTLTTLKRHEGINQGGMADLLEVEPITLSRMIDRLEEANLVERRPDPADRRAWQIFLTPKALPILDQLRVLAEGMIETALFGLDPAQRDQLMASLATIRTNLNTQFESDEANHG
jgi:DNA-binding MarR family transcriptional regulator